MGLPEILIDFKTQAETAVIRSENGIVALILDDTTKTNHCRLHMYMRLIFLLMIGLTKKS